MTTFNENFYLLHNIMKTQYRDAFKTINIEQNRCVNVTTAIDLRRFYDRLLCVLFRHS